MLTVNAIGAFALLGVPAILTLPLPILSLVGIGISVGSWVLFSLLRRAALRNGKANPVLAARLHTIQNILQLAGIALSFLGLIIPGAGLIAIPATLYIPEWIRIIIKIIPYLVFFETFRLSPYAISYFMKGIAEAVYNRKNDVYHVRPFWKTGRIGHHLYRTFVGIEKNVKTVREDLVEEFKLELEDMRGNDDDSYEYTITSAEYNKLISLLDKLADISEREFAREFAKIIINNGSFFKGVFKWNLTRMQEVKARIVYWMNNKYRLDAPAPVLYSRFMPAVDVIINTANEDGWYTRQDLNTADVKTKGEITTRLGMLARFKPELWECLLRKLEELGVPEEDKKTLKELTRHPEREVVLSEATWDVVVKFGNYHLPTGWANALTFTKMRRSYVFRLERMGYTKREAEEQAVEMVRIIYRWAVKLCNAEVKTVKAQAAGKVTSSLRKYLYLQEYRNSGNDVEQYIRNVSDFTDEQKEALRLAVSKDVMLIWTRLNVPGKENEVLWKGKYNHMTQATPYLIGQTSFLADADHHCRLEGIWHMPEAGLEFLLNPRLGSSVPVVDHHLGENIGGVGKAMPVGENAFYGHAQIGKQLTGGLGAYGKFWVRTQALRWSEGLTGEYVAEDIETAIRFRSFGYNTSKIMYITLGKNWPYQWIDSRDPTWKWAENSIESAVGRVPLKMLLDMNVDLPYKIDNFLLDGFGFYFKKPYIVRYVKWLVVVALIFNFNLFIGLPLVLWICGIVLSQSISYGLLFNNVYEKGQGWFKGILRTINQIASVMYWFFVHQVFMYKSAVGESGAARLCKFIATKGKGGAMKRIGEWAYLYLKSESPVRTGVSWTLLILMFAGFHPFNALLWILTISMFLAAWIAPFVFDSTITAKHKVGNAVNVIKSGFWGLVDSVNFMNINIPLLGRIEKNLSEREAVALHTTAIRLQKELGEDFDTGRFGDEYIERLGFYTKYYSHFRRIYKAPSLILLKVVADMVKKAGKGHKEQYAKVLKDIRKDIKDEKISLRATGILSDSIRQRLLNRISAVKEYLLVLKDAKLINEKDFQEYSENLLKWETKLGRVMVTQESIKYLKAAQVVEKDSLPIEKVMEWAEGLKTNIALRKAILSFLEKQGVIKNKDYFDADKNSYKDSEINVKLAGWVDRLVANIDLRTLLDFLRGIGAISDVEHNDYIGLLGSTYQEKKGLQAKLDKKVKHLSYKQVEQIDWYVTEYEYLPYAVNKYEGAFKGWAKSLLDKIPAIDILAGLFKNPKEFLTIAAVIAVPIAACVAAVMLLAQPIASLMAMITASSLTTYIAGIIGAPTALLVGAPIVALAVSLAVVIIRAPFLALLSLVKAGFDGLAAKIKGLKKINKPQVDSCSLKKSNTISSVAVSNLFAAFKNYLKTEFFADAEGITVFGGAVRDWFFNAAKPECERLNKNSDIDILINIEMDAKDQQFRQQVAMRKMMEKAKIIAEKLGCDVTKFVGSTVSINGKMISVLGAIDQNGNFYILDNFAEAFASNLYPLTVDRVGINLEDGAVYNQDEAALADLENRRLAFSAKVDIKKISFDKLLRLLRFVAQYPGVYLDPQLREEFRVLFGEVNSANPNFAAIKEWQEERIKLQASKAGSANVASTITNAPAGSGPQVQATPAAGTGSQVQVAPAGSGAQVSVAPAAGTGAQTQAAPAGTGAQPQAVQAGSGAQVSAAAPAGTGAQPQAVAVSKGPAVQISTINVRKELGNNLGIVRLVEDIFSHSENKQAVVDFLRDIGAEPFLVENGIDLIELRNKAYVSASEKNVTDAERQASANTVYPFEVKKIIPEGIKTLEEKEAILIKYLLTAENGVEGALAKIYGNADVLSLKEELEKKIEALFNWKPLHRNSILRDILTAEELQLARLNILKAILADYGIDVNKMLKAEDEAEQASEKKAPFVAKNRSRLTLRNPSFEGDEHKADAEAYAAISALEGSSYVYALADMDNISEYHKAFGPNLQYAGKVRIVIGEVIDEINERENGIKVEQYTGGGDKSIIIIKGKANEIEAKKILAEICRNVPLASAHRLAVAELDINSSNTTQFGIIERVTGYKQISWRGKYFILIDILVGETPKLALARTLAEFNAVLERDYGFSLRGRVAAEITPFAISMGAVYVSEKVSKAQITKDTYLKLAKDIKKLGLNVEKIKVNGVKVYLVDFAGINEEKIMAAGLSNEKEIAAIFSSIFNNIKEQAFQELDKSKSVLGKRTVRLSRYTANGECYLLGSDSASLNVAAPIEKTQSAEFYKETEVTKAQGQNENAVIVLKGGNNGGFNDKVYFAVLDRLAEDFEVELGERTNLSAENIIKVWGKTVGIGKKEKGRLARLAKSLEEKGNTEEAQKVLGFVNDINNDCLDLVEFEKWLNSTNLTDTHFKTLRWLWNYMQQPVLPVRLTLKADATKAEVLKKYGFDKVPDDITLQDVVNFIIGEANTRNQPKTLRYIVGNELQFGSLYDFFSESLSKGVPHNAIYSGANGIHCPSSIEYLNEAKIWDNKFATIYLPVKPVIASVNTAAVSGDANELTIASVVDVTLTHRSAQELIEELDRRASELLTAQMPEAELDILIARADYLKDAIRAAYDPMNAGKNTFYHTLVAISNFLVEVSKNIEARTAVDGRLNIYLARDGINFWLAGLLRARQNGTEAEFLANNIVFHLSRSQLSRPVYDAMKRITDDTDVEVMATTRADYWTVYMKNFRNRLSEDAEFRAIAEKVNNQLSREIKSAAGVRIVESFAEGMLTGFVKAVLIYYSAKDASAVEEFITAPKRELSVSRGVERFNFPQADLEKTIRNWFDHEGLVAPDKIDVRPFEVIKEGEETNTDDRLIQRKMLEMQAYHLQYPMAEVNLGHPIEHKGEGVVKSSTIKQLGFYFRELLIINALAAGNLKQGALASEARYNLSQNYSLTAAEKDLFDALVRKHNEIFSTVSDSTQVELLARLSAWIKLLHTIFGTRFDSLAADIIAAEESSEYNWQFERFLFEFREFGNFSDFYKTMTWLLYAEAADSVVLTQAKGISDITNTLRRLRAIIGKVKRNTAGRVRVKIAYGEEELKKKAGSTTARTEKAMDINDMVEKYNASRSIDIEDLYVTVVPVFTSKDGKVTYEYQKGVQARFGGVMSEQVLKVWQKLVDAEFVKLGWVRNAVIDGQERLLMGKRSSALMYVSPLLSILESDKEELVEEEQMKKEFKARKEVEETLDRATRRFVEEFKEYDIRVISIMTTFALPQDNLAFRQVYQSLNRLRLLNRNPAVSEEGSTIFYTTFGEIIASTSATLNEVAQKKAKEEGKTQEPAFGPALTQNEKKETLARIAKIMNRIKDLEAKPVEVYLSYLEWAFKENLGATIIRPEAALDMEQLSKDELARLQRALRRYGINEGTKEGVWPSHIINIVGQARTGKSTLMKALAKHLESSGKQIELVDIGAIYRAYAYFMSQLVNKYGESILESEENILWYLGQAHIWVENGNVYLNGEYLSKAKLQNNEIEKSLKKVRKDHPLVNDFLQQADRSIIQRIDSSKWVIISSRGFYPHAMLNIFLTANIDKRLSNAKRDGDMRPDAEIKQSFIARDRDDEVSETLRKYPRLFTVMRADADVETVVALEVEDLIDNRIKDEEVFTQAQDNIKNELQQAGEDAAGIILLKGGKRGGLDTEIARELMKKISADFEVLADLQKGLTPVEVIKIWNVDLRKMVEGLNEDKISQDNINEGLRYLDEDNGWGFKRWADILAARNRSKKAKLLSFTVKYLSGNIRVIKVGTYKGNEALTAEEYETKLQKIVTAELRLTGKPLPNQELWSLWFGNLKFDPDTGKLGFVTAEAKRLGIPQEEIEKMATGVEVLSVKKVTGLLGSLTIEELSALENNVIDAAMMKRQQLRDVEIPLGNQESVGALIDAVKETSKNAVAPDYNGFVEKICKSYINPVAAFENFIRQGKLSELIPEFKELLYSISSGTMHDSHSMYEHLILSLRSLFYVEEAAQLLNGRSLVDLNTEENEYLKGILVKYQQSIAGLGNATIDDLISFVRVYEKAANIKLSTFGRENDAKTLLLLCVVLHDIGKAISVRQHLILGPQFIADILVRLGFNAEDVYLGQILIANHSFSARVNDGYDSYKALVEQIGVNNPQLENILSAILVMNIADIGGIVSEQALATARLRDYIARIADKSFVEKKAGEEEYSDKLARQIGYDFDKPENEKAIRGQYKAFALELPQSIRAMAVNLASDESLTIHVIKSELAGLVFNHISTLVDFNEILSLLPERPRALVNMIAQGLAAQQKEELSEYYLKILEDLEKTEDLNWFMGILPMAFTSLSQKSRIKELVKGYPANASIETEQKAVIKAYLLHKLSKLSDTYKFKRIQELIDATRDNEFKEFIANTPFYYTGALLKGMSAESVVNFLYLVYKYKSLNYQSSQYAVVSLVSTEVFNPAIAKIMDEKLKQEDVVALIKNVNDADVIKETARGFGIALTNVIQNNQIAVALTDCAAWEVAAKNSPKVKASDLADNGEAISPVKILKSAGWNISDNVVVNVVSREGLKLNINFARAFVKTLGNRSLEGDIMIDLDKQFVVLSSKEFYILKGNIISGEVIYVAIPEELIKEYFYLTQADAVAKINKELALMQLDRYFKLAVLLVFMPQFKSLLGKLSLFDRESINREMKKIEPAIRDYVDTLIAGELLPVQLPITKTEYPAKTKAVKEQKPLDDAKRTKIAGDFGTMAVIFKNRTGESIAEYDAFTHTVTIDENLAARAPPVLLANIITYFSLIAQGFSAKEAQEKLIIESRKNQEDLGALIKALKDNTADNKAYLDRLNDSVAVYPAQFGDSISGKRRDGRLNRYIGKAKSQGYEAVVVEDNSMTNIARYELLKDKVQIILDSRLAIIAPVYNENDIASRAFQVLINDIFAHAKLYKEGNDKWAVWAK
ncbi:MAG: (d)CMP kinase, partial [Candidatus Omnitrophica bacterium]|nr:(d)CMP kinase [Candidatus Omnitrophota bacterium]